MNTYLIKMLLSVGGVMKSSIIKGVMLGTQSGWGLCLHLNHSVFNFLDLTLSLNINAT